MENDPDVVDYIIPGDSYNLTGNVTLYAQWIDDVEPSVSISVNGNKVENGKTIEVSGIANLELDGWDVNNKENGYSYKITKSGTTIEEGTITVVESLPVYTQLGETGTYQVTASMTDGYGNSTTVSITVVVNIEYTITYNAAGGTGGPTSQTGNGEVTITSETPTREGYTFKGWSTTQNETNINNVIKPGDTYNLTSNVTLYAQWIDDIAPSVTISVNGTNVENGKTVEVSGKTTIGFEGWDVNNYIDSYKYTIKKDGAIVKNGTIHSTESMPSYEELEEVGRYEITATMPDSAGNSTTVTITVVVKRPTLHTSLYTEGLLATSESGAQWSNSDIIYLHDVSLSKTYEYTLDNGSTWNECISGGHKGDDYYYIQLTKEGTNKIRVREAGIESDDYYYSSGDTTNAGYSDIYYYKLDKTAPVINVSQNAATGVEQVKPTISITDSLSGLKTNTIQYAFSTSEPAEEEYTTATLTNGKVTVTSPEGVTGTYYLYIKGVSDKVGNESTVYKSGAYVLRAKITITGTFSMPNLELSSDGTYYTTTYAEEFSVELKTTGIAKGETVKIVVVDMNSNSYDGEWYYGDVSYYYEGNVTIGELGEGYFYSSKDIEGKLYLRTYAIYNGVKYEITKPIIVYVEDEDHIITYNANGGTGGPIAQVGNGEVTITSETPTREGYTFKGWSTTQNETNINNMIKPGDTYNLTSNVTLYAQWIDDVKPSVGITVNGTEVASGTTIEVSGIANLELDGWDVNNKEDGYTYKITKSGTTIEEGIIKFVESLPVYTKLEEVGTYEVTATMTDIYGNSTTVTITVVVKRPTLHTSLYTEGLLATSESGAQWSNSDIIYLHDVSLSKTYEYTLDNGSTWNECISGGHKGDDYYYIQLTKEGTNKIRVREAGIESDDYYYSSGDTTNAGYSDIYYYKLDKTAPVINVTPNSISGVKQVKPTISITDSLSGLKTNTIQYVFSTSTTVPTTGYQTATLTNGKVTVTSPEGANGTYYLYIKPIEDNVENASSVYKSGTYILKEIYTITYNAAGGTGGPTSQTGNGEVTITSETPTREGYTFQGWSTMENDPDVVDYIIPGDSYNLTGNVTLYAQWIDDVEPSVSISVNGNKVEDGKTIEVSGTANLELDGWDVNSKENGYSYKITKSGTTIEEGTIRFVESLPVYTQLGETGTYQVTASMTDGYGNSTTVSITVVVNIEYTITYNAAGGTGGPTSQTGNGEVTITSETPTREGYTFKGWSTMENDPDVVDYIIPGDSYNLTGNVTLYAQWIDDVEPSVSISVNGNKVENGKTIEVSGTANLELDGWDVNSKENGYSYKITKSGTTIEEGTIRFVESLPVYTQLGEAGTYQVTASMTDGYGNSTTVSITVVVNIEYTITYNAAGGTGGPTSQTGNGEVTITSETPTREGYTFKGWSTMENDPDVVDYIIPGDSYNLTGNVTLYAQWIDDVKPSVGITVNGTEVASGKTIEVSGIANLELDGWDVNNKENGYSYKITKSGTTIEEGIIKFVESLPVYTKLEEVGTYEVTATMTDIYGNSTTVSITVVVNIEYTITYNAAGGTGGPTSQTGNGEVTITSETPTREGYTFQGWSTMENDPDVVDYIIPGDSYNLTGNVTLYAQWIDDVEPSVSISVNGNKVEDGKTIEVSGIANLELDGWDVNNKENGYSYKITKSGTTIEEGTIRFVESLPVYTQLEEAGTYQVTASMTDGYGNSTTVSITVVVKTETISVTGVTLDKTTLSMEEGTTATLTATILPENATNKAVTWQTIESTNVVTMTQKQDGTLEIKANEAGTTTIVVRTIDGGHTASCTVTVTKPTILVTGVSLDKITLSMEIGNSDTLTATITPENATNKAVTWKSSDQAVVTVDQTGKVTAVSAGEATITVTTADGGHTASCTVTVTKPTILVTGVSLDKTTLSMEIGNSDTLIATITPENATNKAVTWKSSNQAVATVDQTGKVTAVGEGEATITVTTADGGHTANCKVTVTKPENPTIPVASVSLNKTSLLMEIGNSQTLTATVLPTGATNKAVTWKSSNQAVATVDQTGKVTAVSAGEATITVTTADGGKTATCKVTVKEPVVSVTGVTVTPKTLELEVGKTGTLTATVTPSNATNQNITWASSDKTVATIQNGVVTAVGEGEATITVTTADGGKTASCKVTVTKPEEPTPEVKVTGVTVTPKTLKLEVGKTETLIATITPSNATNQNITWTSSDKTVATIQNGVVTAVGEGEATITVTTADGGHTANCKVTVTKSEEPEPEENIPLESVTLENGEEVSEIQITEGDKQVIKITITPNDASIANITWTSSDRSVATVDQNGVVTAVGDGTAIITVTITDKDGNIKTAKTTVTIKKATSNHGNSGGASSSNNSNAQQSDKTTATTVIPQTGISRVILVAMIIILINAVVMFIRYKKVK